MGKERNIFIYYLLGRKSYFLEKARNDKLYFLNIIQLLEFDMDFDFENIEEFFETYWTGEVLDNLFVRLISLGEVIPEEVDDKNILATLQKRAFECMDTYKWVVSENFHYRLYFHNLDTQYSDNAFWGDLNQYAFKHARDKLNEIGLNCFIFFKRTL